MSMHRSEPSIDDSYRSHFSPLPGSVTRRFQRRRPRLAYGSVLLAMLFQAACAVYPPTPDDAPVTDNVAVASLVDHARLDVAAGRYDTANANLERALRIEPRNAALWRELARLRLQQGQYQQAENLAARSNAYAGTNKVLRAANWRLIGDARSQQGDVAGAQAAFRKADEVER